MLLVSVLDAWFACGGVRVYSDLGYLLSVSVLGWWFYWFWVGALVLYCCLLCLCCLRIGGFISFGGLRFCVVSG